ncbi:tyrosine-protein phosphatase [Streptacidiphilus sp. N1-12]|uniref:Tyrosine-protein phosphatase n=2 Tax=Streptacidiphilus alkalitolerans TaxID=3342712 RepID=A0ABV6WF73_9ACTN
MTDPQTAAGRSLGLKTAVNARDLGGYRTADGRTVRTGVALRSDALSRLTDADLAVLTGLGVRAVVDLRGMNEVTANGADRLPDDGSVRLVHLPVYSAEHDIYLSLRDVLAGQDAVAQQALLGDGGAERIMAEMYGWFVTDPAIRGLFAEAVRMLADPNGTPLVFHCTAGKDRTGWTAAIVLTALGVDRATVYEDYLLTNTRSAALMDRIMEVFRTNAVMEDPTLMMPVIRAEASYLDAAFAAVAQGWPTFDAFLTDGLALDPATLSALRKNLLTD